MAKQILQSLKNDNNYCRQTFNEQNRLIRNYDTCMSYCKSSDYIFCLYDTSSSKYAIKTIQIYEPECSEIRDFTDVITFTEYIENGEIKKLPYNCRGVIPNFKYVIGDEKTFENNHRSCYHRGHHNNYYLIDVRIPFVMD